MRESGAPLYQLRHEVVSYPLERLGIPVHGVSDTLMDYHSKFNLSSLFHIISNQDVHI